MFRLLNANYPSPPNTHTSPDAPIFSYLLLVHLPSQNLQKTLEDIKASERKERRHQGFREKRTSGPFRKNLR